MKAIRLLPLVLALCTLPLTAQTKLKANVAAAATQPIGIAFNWSYTANAPACTTSNKNCQSGFTLTRTDVTPNVVIGTPSSIAASSTSFTWTPTGGLPFGTMTFSLVANGFDLNGNALTSTAATTSVTNGLSTLNAPTGLTGSVQ
jgi:hypothetical protein